MSGEIINIIQVKDAKDAAFFAEGLFQKTFSTPLPEMPMHYVALAKTGATTFETVGYYHVIQSEEFALVGGLCVDERYRQRGIGEALSAAAFADAGERKAFFAHIGNPVSVRIALRIGYVATPYEHLMVRWMKSVVLEEQERLIREVAAIGPF